MLERGAGEEVQPHADGAEDEEQERHRDEGELDSRRSTFIAHQATGREAPLTGGLCRLV